MIKILILFLLISCGKEPNNITYKNDPYFNKYKEEFILYLENNSLFIDNYTKNKIKRIPISFKKINNYNAGICRGNVAIKIDPFYKNFEKGIYIKKIVFHELGHCIFNLEHNLEDYNDLMYHSLITPFFNPNFIDRIIL